MEPGSIVALMNRQGLAGLSVVRERVLAIVAMAALASPFMAGSPAVAATPSPSPASFAAVCPPATPGTSECLALRGTAPVTPAGSGSGVSPAATTSYGPSDLQSAYALPSGTQGSGMTVAVVDAYDLPTAESDLGTYRSSFGLPACTTANGCFRKVDQTGGTNYPPSNSGWGGEIALDIEMVSAICPNCHILLVEANDSTDTNLGIAVDEAVSLGAMAVSNSYGGPEFSTEGSAYDAYYNHPGVAVTVATGDCGYDCSGTYGGSHSKSVEYPAASPYVIAVGGTSLVRDGSTRGWTETAWGDSYGGGGSGCSAYEAKPSWQHDPSCAKRMEADVSAVADPATGVQVYDAGSWYVFGGTSVASPIVAAVYALAGTPTPGTYPASYLYAGSSQLNDAVGGSNATYYSCSITYYCNAVAGYDGPTGLGTPNGTAAFMPATVPGKPTAVSATPGNASALVSWSAPSSNGGSAITGYTVASTPSSAGCTTTGALSCTVSGLTNGQSYTFTVTATNAVGPGAASDPSPPVTPVGPPGKPTGVAATPGNASASVSWLAPATDGGSAITGYTVASSPSSAGCTTTGALSCTVSGLTNGQSYTFTVTATNGIGTGPPSDPSAAVTPATVPGAPTGVTATRGNASAAVAWSAPASNGGATITSYTVTASDGTHTCGWTSGQLSCTVSGLTNGVAYTFTVTATNWAGTGSPSGPSNSVTPATVPGQPTGVGGTPGNASAVVSWTAPSDDGGSAITGYTVASSPSSAGCTTAGALSCTVSGLTDGQGYTFTVTAANSVGPGLPSGPSATVTPATVPGAPTGVTATRGDASALVSWSAPSSNGGAAITSYTVTASDGIHTCGWSGGSLSCTVSGLTNGQSYTFTVTATNWAGTGAPSSPSNSVVPAAVPGPPTGVGGTPGNASAVVSWLAPSDDGGSAITGYTVSSSPSSAGCTTGGTLSCTVSGLTNGQPYTFTVTATNSAGTGLPSDPSTPVTPGPTAPGQPTGLSATPGHGTATLSWTAPADNGSAITGYTVTEVGLGVVGCVMTGTTSCIVTGLSAGQPYTFTVSAVNGVGTGPASAPSNSVVPLAGTVASTYHPMTPPVRYVDTRTGNGLSGRLLANTPATFYVTAANRPWSPGSTSVPNPIPADASAVTGNLTVTGSTFGWAVYLGPAPLANPGSSTINFTAGETTANGVTVALGADGSLSATYLSTAGQTTDLVFDVTGYFTPDLSGATYHALSPVRLLDTRYGNGLSAKLLANTPTQFFVTAANRAGSPVPADATAVTGNVTVVNETFAWAVYVGPVANAAPTTSTLNFNAGDIKANNLTVTLGAGGSLWLTYMSTPGNTTDLVFDVTGYYTADVSGSVYVPLTPARLLDTRVGNGLSGPIPANTPEYFAVTGRGGVPGYATAVTGNVTVTDPTFAWAVYVGPVDTASPSTSTVNFNAGDTKANGVTVSLGGGGVLWLDYMSTSGNTTDLVFDVTGFYEPAGS
jgi:Fibronectin type III domain